VPELPEARRHSRHLFLLVPNRGPDVPCPRDGGRIEDVEVVGRTTYLRPEHQERIG
jgi:hypothetical protein